MKTSKSTKGNPKNDEFYTPKYIFDALDIEFDLDVSAPKGGINWLPANNHYHQEVDGLSQDWYGKVWCNPPYSHVTPWVDKFLQHGNGICLLPFSKSKWFNKIWDNIDGIIAIDVTFKFERFDGQRKDIFMPILLGSKGSYCTDKLANSGLGVMR